MDAGRQYGRMVFIIEAPCMHRSGLRCARLVCGISVECQWLAAAPHDHDNQTLSGGRL